MSRNLYEQHSNMKTKQEHITTPPPIGPVNEALTGDHNVTHSQLTSLLWNWTRPQIAELVLVNSRRAICLSGRSEVRNRKLTIVPQLSNIFFSSSSVTSALDRGGGLVEGLNTRQNIGYIEKVSTWVLNMLW